jgi:hypothetical protein
MEIPFYTWGALLHNIELMIPYGLADQAGGFVTATRDEAPAMQEEDHGPG